MPDDQALGHLALRGLLEGVGGSVIAGALQQVGAGVVDADHGRARQLLLARVQLLDADAQPLGDLFLVGRAAELRLQPAGGVAQLVATDDACRATGCRASAGRRAWRRGCGTRRRPRSDRRGWDRSARPASIRPMHARRDQVVDLDVGGEATRQAAGDLLDVGKKLGGVLVAAREQLPLGRLFARLAGASASSLAGLSATAFGCLRRRAL